MHTRRTETKC